MNTDEWRNGVQTGTVERLWLNRQMLGRIERDLVLEDSGFPTRIELIQNMILEGLVTTLSASGEVNVAPMGPVVDPELTRFRLRPFQTSRTFQNLREHPAGVVHITDDVLLIARAALNLWEETPATFCAKRIRGKVLKSACRWFEFEVESMDLSSDRTEVVLRVVHEERLRDFWGFNRAKHAVLEATILATRLHLLSGIAIIEALNRYREPVEKTAGPEELTAFQLVWDYVHKNLPFPEQNP